MILQAEHHATTKFALRASEVILDSEVHFVSEVSPDGETKGSPKQTCRAFRGPVKGKLNFTFATAKTSLSKKRELFQKFSLFTRYAINPHARKGISSLAKPSISRPTGHFKNPARDLFHCVIVCDNALTSLPRA